MSCESIAAHRAKAHLIAHVIEEENCSLQGLRAHSNKRTATPRGSAAGACDFSIELRDARHSAWRHQSL